MITSFIISTCSGVGERHVLPGFCFVLLVDFERRELVRDRTLAPGGSQPVRTFGMASRLMLPARSGLDAVAAAAERTSLLPPRPLCARLPAEPHTSRGLPRTSMNNSISASSNLCRRMRCFWDGPGAELADEGIEGRRKHQAEDRDSEHSEEDGGAE
jgi:hypothetical protein